MTQWFQGGENTVRDKETRESSYSKDVHKLSVSQTVQLFFAILLTLTVIVALPTYSWYSYQKEIAITTKINSPSMLEIKAGGKPGEEQGIINFEMSDIDVEDQSHNTYEEDGKTYHYKDFVFCVKGKSISSYDLQLVHTTNIPFRYQIFRAVQDDNGTIVYVSKDKTVTQNYRLARVKILGGRVQVDADKQVIYEDYSTPLDGNYINAVVTAGGRVIANNQGDGGAVPDLTGRSYDTGDSYQVYANPVYWLKRDIPVYTEEKTDDGFTHSYVLRVSWVMRNENDDREDLDIVQNNKETDIIYITTAVH